MASVNKVVLIGNCGRDPEIRTFPSGGQVANVSIATTESWKDKQSGERRELTEWHNVVFSDRLAEIVGQYVKKGSSVYIEGRIRTRKWQDQNGQDRYTTEIRADVMQLLGGREGGQERTGQSSQPAPRQAPPRQAAPAQRDSGFEDDDIPF